MSEKYARNHFQQSDPSLPNMYNNGITSFDKGWQYYYGSTNGINVTIDSRDDAAALSCMGSFGTWLPRKTNQEGKKNSTECDDHSHLILTLEEAFFLSYALGCLFVTCGSKELDLQGQWNLFCATKKEFPTSYAVYHHFRAKGWVPKEGLKFGVDYVLYKEGPAYYHANYAVAIRPVKNGVVNGRLTWSQMTGLCRLVSSVAKNLLYCDVFIPENTDSPNCLKGTSISSIAFSRWASPKEREDERDIDTTF